MEQRSTRPNGRLRCQMNSEQCEVRSQNCKARTHRTVRCATGLSGAARGQRTSMVNHSKPQRSADVARTRQWTVQCPVHHRTVRCAIDNNDWNSGWGYKYPPTTTIQAIQVFWTPHSIQEQKHSLQDTFKRSNSLQASKSTQLLVTWERVFSVSFVALVAWIAFSFSLYFF
jgi:hypothetical protein